MAGLFGGIEAAKVSEQGSYLEPGTYPDLEILEVKVGQSRKKEAFFCVKLKVHKSIGPGAAPAGSERDWMVMMRWDGALGHIKGFAAAACGIDQSEVDEAGIEQIVAEPKAGETQPLTGMHASAQAVNVTTKAGGAFTRVSWAPFDAAEAAKITAPPAPPAAPATPAGGAAPAGPVGSRMFGKK